MNVPETVQLFKLKDFLTFDDLIFADSFLSRLVQGVEG